MLGYRVYWSRGLGFRSFATCKATWLGGLRTSVFLKSPCGVEQGVGSGVSGLV